MVELLTLLGLVPCGGNYAAVRRRLLVLGPLDHRFRPRAEVDGTARLRDVTPAQLTAAVEASATHAGVLRFLGLPVDARLYRALKEALRAQGVDVGHFSGQAWARGRRRATHALDGGPRSRSSDGLRKPSPPADRGETPRTLLQHLSSHHVAGAADRAGARPRQRRARRQPAGEPAAAVSELPRADRHLARSQHPPPPGACLGCSQARVVERLYTGGLNPPAREGSRVRIPLRVLTQRQALPGSGSRPQSCFSGSRGHTSGEVCVVLVARPRPWAGQRSST